jgi:hypothetical protein
VGNGSVYDPDTATTMTFFFVIDDKSFVPTFNYLIRNTSKYWTTHLIIHLYLQAYFLSVGRDFTDGVFNIGGYGEGKGGGTGNDVTPWSSYM